MESLTLINAFTIDVEDYFQVSAFADRVAISDWDAYECRVEQNTFLLLDLLDEFNVRGTFFVLGWIADRFPELVREIDRRGHEIGTHSYHHRLVYQQTAEEFRADLQRGIGALSRLTSQEIVCYRAPSFSITRQSQWALKILVEEGIRYDSSIFPIVHDRYGIPDAAPFPHVMSISKAGGALGELFEFPMSVHRAWKFNLPISGGGYFRLYPYKMTARYLARINKCHQQPFVFYIHPWEIDPRQPRLPGSLRTRFRHYQNLNSTLGKLRRLLKQFRFSTLTEAWQASPACQALSPAA